MPDLKFEIGHVLFIDIVGYSKLLIKEQREQLQALKTIVRGTEQFRLAKAEGKLLRVPQGVQFRDVYGSALPCRCQFQNFRSQETDCVLKQAVPASDTRAEK